MAEGVVPITYTTQQLAKMFNVAAGSIKNWEENGSIPAATRTPGGKGGGPGHRRYSQTHVDALTRLLMPAQSKPVSTPAGATEASNAGTNTTQ